MKPTLEKQTSVMTPQSQPRVLRPSKSEQFHKEFRQRITSLSRLLKKNPHQARLSIQIQQPKNLSIKSKLYTKIKIPSINCSVKGNEKIAFDPKPNISNPFPCKVQNLSINFPTKVNKKWNVKELNDYLGLNSKKRFNCYF